MKCCVYVVRIHYLGNVLPVIPLAEVGNSVLALTTCYLRNVKTILMYSNSYWHSLNYRYHKDDASLGTFKTPKCTPFTYFCFQKFCYPSSYCDICGNCAMKITVKYYLILFYVNSILQTESLIWEIFACIKVGAR
jgi:hypothetical protein